MMKFIQAITAFSKNAKVVTGFVSALLKAMTAFNEEMEAQFPEKRSSVK